MTPSVSRPPVVRLAVSLVLSLAIAFPPNLFAMGPLERNHPAVEEGMDAYQEGRFEDALSAFDQAQAELPDRPLVQLNRGDALYKLGRMDEARQAYQKAVELDRKGELGGKDYYNLGNTWAAMDKPREAISAYRRALTLNPEDALARHNLEVLLRKLPPPPPPPQDGGTDGGQDGGEPDAGKPDGGTDGGTPDGGPDAGADAGQSPSDGGEDGGAPDGGQGDGGPQDGGQGDGGSQDGGQGQGPPEQQDGGDGQPDPDTQTDGGTGDEEDPSDAKLEEGGDELDAGVGLSKDDTERLLDAIQENEKNLQLWRFQQKKKKRRPDGKDW